MEPDALVRDYLGRLEAAAWPLPAERRLELVAEVREHIESALAESGQRDEVTTRNVLDRLGAPEEIVAAEAEGMDRRFGAAFIGAQPAALGFRWGASEVAAIAFLTAGSVFLPFIGPLVGLAFAWSSTQWTRRQKWVATLIVVGLLMVPVIALMGARVSVGA